MALTVQTNMAALKAQRYTGLMQNKSTDSIERLSSGFRINSPADDASGLSIAETLKGQIKGLDRAYMNVQDGLSMLQVADGALVDISNMLQRMRELSVQASNGIYSSSDRSFIQQEVDALKNEINRVSVFTEFNERKLLNGDGVSMWNVDSDAVELIMNDYSPTGNYDLKVKIDPGQNAIYQSNALKYLTDQVGVKINSGEEFVDKINPLDLPAEAPNGDKIGYSLDVKNRVISQDDDPVVIMGATDKESFSDFPSRMKDVDVNRSGYLQMEVNKDMPGSNEWKDGEVRDDILTLTWYDAKGDTTESVKAPITYNDNPDYQNAIGFPDNMYVDLTSLSAFKSGTLDLRGKDDLKTGDKVLMGVSDYNTEAYSTPIIPDFLAPPSEESSTTTRDVTVANFTSEENLSKLDKKLSGDFTANQSGYLKIDFLQDYPDMLDFSTPLEDGTPVEDGAPVENGAPVEDGAPVDYGTPKDNTTIENYAKLTWFDKEGNLIENTVAPVDIDNHYYLQNYMGYADDYDIGLTDLQAIDSGYLDIKGLKDIRTGDSVTFAIGPDETYESRIDDFNNRILDTMSAGDTEWRGEEEYTVYLNSVSDPGKQVGIQYSKLSGSDQSFQQVEMTEDGQIWTAKYNVSFKDPLLRNDGTVEFESKTAKTTDNVALDTKLKDIGVFTTDEGQQTFGVAQDLTVYAGNGKSSTIHLTGADTIKDFDIKLTDALVEMGVATDDPTINENLVTFITPDNKDDFANGVYTEGTFVIQSSAVGEGGKLYFQGDENLIRGLGISKLSDAVENLTYAELYDTYTGNLVGTQSTKDNRIINLLPGADILLDPRAGAKMVWDTAGSGMLKYTSAEDSFGIHTKDTRSFVQAGANPEQFVRFALPQVDTTSLGLDDVFIVDAESATEGIYKIDQAQTRLNDLRGRFGAQMNAMEHALNELEVSSTNMNAAEGRIRDLDMAKEMTEFTKNQILAQTSTAMLAQANMMPQLVLQLLGA